MPISRLLAERHVQEQTAKLAAHKQRSLWPKFLFHTTYVSNAVEIVRNGYLSARSELKNFHDVANQGALNAYTGSHNYARLYFRPKNGYHIKTEGIKCLSDPHRQSNQNSIPVNFLFDLPEVLTLPGSKFTQGNIQRSQNHELDGDANFKTLDFDAIYHDDYTSANNKDYILDRRMAEVMVPNKFPLEPALRAIIFRTNYDFKTFAFYLKEQGLVCKYKTLIEKTSGSVFMHWGLYITEINFVEDKLTIKFHFPKTKPPDNSYRIYVCQRLLTGETRTLDDAIKLTSPTLTITNFAASEDSKWTIRLEEVLAFEGRLAHTQSQVFG